MIQNNYADKVEVVRLSTQIDHLIETVQEFKEDYKEMKETVKSLEKSSSFLSGAFKAICYAATIITALIIYKEQFGALLVSLNTYVDQPSHYAYVDGIKINSYH